MSAGVMSGRLSPTHFMHQRLARSGSVDKGRKQIHSMEPTAMMPHKPLSTKVAATVQVRSDV